MARRAFYSFHYVPDNWRAFQVRNMGVVEGNNLRQTWIDGQLSGKSVAIVPIGAKTAGRKWTEWLISIPTLHP